MRKTFNIALFSIFVLAIGSSYAQTFPVNATVQLTPPYSLNLSDYASPESERLAFMIVLADINRPELQVKFRLRIEGQGIEITTSPGYNPLPYILQGGIPERITGFDLAPYFNPANLEFRGISRAQYQQTAKLPEGLYRICIEVVEYNRNVVVSNTGCANAWLVLNDPPIVNVPRNGDKIRILNPQNIIFQWTPRHTGSPNAAFRTDYECTLVELWPESRNPNDAILSSLPILQETTSSTTFIYGPAETPLVAGRHYAFRVRAKSISGISELDLFKNNGYSEVITFRYGDPCLPPEPITATVLDPERIKLEWTGSAQHTEYAVQYRAAGTARWYDQETYLPYTTLTNLRPSSKYEYQVKAVCGPVESEGGKIGSATTKDLAPSNLVCGTAMPIFQLDNTQLLNQLFPGDVVQAGDFEVSIKRVTGTGSFTGSGTVDVAFFKHAKVNVEFESIKVNPEYRMVEGKMEVKGVGIDVLPDKMTDLMNQLGEALAIADDVLNDIAQGLELADEILGEVGELANEILDNGPFTPAEEAELDGISVSQYLAKANEAMKSAAGALADAPSVGNTAKAARSAAQAIALKSRANRLQKIYDQSDTLKVIAVEFVATNPYGYDKQGYPQHRLHYNIMVTPDNASTSIPWAATKSGEASTVTARLIPSAKISSENISFKAGEIALTANWSGNEWVIALPAMDAGATLTLRAIDNATGETVGKMDVVAYAPIARKVNIVPIGSEKGTLNASDVEDELNRIYKQAVADWSVAILPSLAVPNYTGTLQDDEQALLSVYSDGMKEIIRAFEASGSFNKDEFYLFLVDNSQTGKAGYMPRKHRYGFIYQNENASPLQTIAHELGHGAFRLQHTFEEYPTITAATSNLMDYNNGTVLRKYQWDLIHTPPLVIGLLEDLDEGAYETDGHYSTIYLISLMLGMPQDLSERLAKAAEKPDTYIHNEYQFELNDTWSDGKEQRATHSLTYGFHGTEELITALSILYTPEDNIDDLGKLLHRYGDTYAHTRLDNLTPQQWDEIDEYETITWFIDKWMKFINEGVKEKGLLFLGNRQLQEKYLSGETLTQFLNDNYLVTSSQGFRMYGKLVKVLGITLEHMKPDGAQPDFIYIRPNWYLRYVNNLASILATKYSVPISNLDYSIFQKMVEYSVQEQCSLKGIIDYEISKVLKKNYFFIPVYYSKQMVASGDAVFFTDYIEQAEKIKDETLKYLKQEYGIDSNRLTIEPQRRAWYNPILNKNRLSYLYAYKIIVN